MANDAAKYKPTIFVIYDKSTVTNCDRLINIRPFNWFIWAHRKELYVLNPEGGIRCGVNATPAIRILRNTFVECCLRINYDSILRSYRDNSQIYEIPYEIGNKTTFTIFSALNILVRNYINFDEQLTKSPIVPINTTDIIGDGVIPTANFDFIHKMRGRKRLAPEHMVRLMSFHKKNTHQLHDAFKQHVKR